MSDIMKFGKSEKKKEKDYYKIATFVLLAILIVAVLAYGLSWYGNMKFSQGASYGQQVTIQQVMKEVSDNQQVNLNYNGQNVTLVPYNVAVKAREDAILQIMNKVDEQGYVSLYNNDTEVVLVPHQGASTKSTNMTQ